MSTSERPPRRIFASYSRKDARQVYEVVRLLRATGAPVFLDTDTIPLGAPWRKAIETAISAADAVVVFWTTAAAESSEVRGEYELGISLAKDIIPVQLDDFPLPESLAEYNGLSLYDLFVPHDVTFSAQPYMELFVNRLLAQSGP